MKVKQSFLITLVLMVTSSSSVDHRKDLLYGVGGGLSLRRSLLGCLETANLHPSAQMTCKKTPAWCQTTAGSVTDAPILFQLDGLTEPSNKTLIDFVGCYRFRSVELERLFSITMHLWQ